MLCPQHPVKLVELREAAVEALREESWESEVKAGV